MEIEFSVTKPPDELLLCIILEDKRLTYYLGYPKKIGLNNVIAWMKLPRIDDVCKESL